MKPFRALYWLFGIFLGLGCLFILLGLLIAPAFPQEGDFDGGTMFLLIFGGIGLLFALIGGIGLFVQIHAARHRKTLLREGMRIAAEITEIQPDHRITVNGRHPYRLTCQYRDEATSTVYVFRSGLMSFNPASLIRGNTVEVCVDPYDFSKYAVDVESALGGYRVQEV